VGRGFESWLIGDVRCVDGLFGFDFWSNVGVLGLGIVDYQAFQFGEV